MAFRLGPAAAALVLLLGGCAGAPPKPGSEGGGSDDLEEGVLGQWNYTTLHPGADPFTLDLEGALTPPELFDGQSVPTGPGPSCCSFDWVDASDVLQADQLVALRVTLDWTNTPENHAGIDAAACMPWACAYFEQGPNEAQQMGPHSDTITFITSGRADFLGFDGSGDPTLGARYSDAAVSTSLEYTLHVEAFPVGDGLGVADPYLLAIPAGGNLSVELVGPYAEEVQAGLMFFDADDRPAHWHRVTGPHGSRHDVPVPAGEWVVFPFEAFGGFARLSVDRSPMPPEMRRLEETFGVVDVATIPDAQERRGTFEYDAPPASLDTFPWFVFDGAPAAQDTFGLPNGDAVGGPEVTLSSSSGDIAVVAIREVSIGIPNMGRVCLQCNGQATFVPENYIDDDGTYGVDWRSRGGSGRFVLFTAQYARP